MKIKDENTWFIQFDLKSSQIEVGGWLTPHWVFERVSFPIRQDQLTSHQYQLPLDLFKDERADYRFNLNSADPKLFFIFGVNEDESLQAIKITASQACAASFLDGEGQVLSLSMPLPVQIWIEAFLGRHGEAEEGRKKKRKGGKLHG